MRGSNSLAQSCDMCCALYSVSKYKLVWALGSVSQPGGFCSGTVDCEITPPCTCTSLFGNISLVWAFWCYYLIRGDYIPGLSIVR